MKYTKKETWDRALEFSQESEKLAFINSCLEFLISKGCEKVFYIFFSHYNIVLAEYLGNDRNFENEIVIGFGIKFNVEDNLQAINKLVNNQETKLINKDRKELVEIKEKLARRLDILPITITIKNISFTHLTKINEYDEFEIILDKIMTNYT